MINTTASTQYNDWIGGAAFDNADITTLSDYAKKNKLIGANDIIYSFEASYCHLRQEMIVSVFYTDIHFDEFKNSGAKLSKKEFDVPVANFFTLFKRANFAVAKKGM